MVKSFLRRYWSVAAIVVFGLVLTLATLNIERENNAEHFSHNLKIRAADEAARIQRSLDTSIEVLSSIGGFFDSSEMVERHEFSKFVTDRLKLHSELLAVEWVPRVTETDRSMIDAELANLGQVLGITEFDANGHVIPARKRKQYFPVFYVEPYPNKALGFDIASRQNVAKTMERATDLGEICVSDPSTLLQGDGNIKGIALLRPVYRGATHMDSVDEKRRNLSGFAVAVLSPTELFATALRGSSPSGLDVLLLSSNVTGEQDTLHFHSSRSRSTPIQAPERSEYRAGPHYEVSLNVPGENWSLLFRPAPAFYKQHESSKQFEIIGLGLLLTLIGVAGRINNINNTQRILGLAQQDALTGLPNRVLFQDRLQQALARSERMQTGLAVLFLDLDRFKHINDSLGHALGDELLQEVALRLPHQLRKEDTVARMGGDEFIILLPEISDDQAPAVLAEKLLDAVRQPYRIAGRTFYLSASIGISLYPQDGVGVDPLIANADAAMYRAKEKGRNGYEFYSKDLTVAATERWQLESDLRHALEMKTVQVRYQPEIDLENGNIIGAEALAYWDHPGRGNIPAERFIPIAEDSGLIVELGEYVLEHACRQAVSWLDEGYPLRVAVNVSGRQIQRSNFVETVERVLQESGLPPEYLELEVTESLVIDQAEIIVDVLVSLSRVGVTLSIDDFGTGYSSLAYLKRLPIDKLKIDRSFIRDLPMDEEDVAITQAVIALARSLGLRTIAEGVETREQSEFLLQAGCGLAQGFLFGYPVPPQEFPLERVQPVKA